MLEELNRLVSSTRGGPIFATALLLACSSAAMAAHGFGAINAGQTFDAAAVLSISAVQGSVGESDNGLLHRSPYAPPTGNGPSSQTILVQGVIYQKTLARTSSGSSQNGFFMQSPAAQTDGNPQTSDGIFVFMGSFTSLIGGYVPRVGDEVILSARVTEFFNLTELTSASLVQLVRSGVALDAELGPFAANPPDDVAEANRYWERHEGMRAQIQAQSLVLDGRNVFPSTMDAEVWVLNATHPIAQRINVYARRSFRDFHPLDNTPGAFDDGNGYRVVLGSLGLKGAAGDDTALIAPSRTFDVVINAPVGGVYFSFQKYQVQIEEQLALRAGADPALNSPPTPDRAPRRPSDMPSSQILLGVTEFSVATFNVENLYDFRDDPFDGCDFAGNSGCPGVSPPFDYVPESDAAYQTRLTDLARQVIKDLHNPAVLLIQEAEDQDICSVSGGSLVCTGTNDVDGRPDTLQELALRIGELGGPSYAAAFDRDGADDRGIVSAFLYRTDRVEMLNPSPSDPVLGANPLIDYLSAALPYNADVQNPKALNALLPAGVDTSTGVDGNNVFTRAPQVGLFRVWRDAVGRSIFHDVYLVDNHFSSVPDARVGQRTEQARYNAAIVAAIQGVRPRALVAVGGDLNVFPRPDDPFAPGDPLFPSDQLAPLYGQGMVNLFDTLVEQVSASAYSYVFDGQAQTLDQIFVSPVLWNKLTEIRAAHINSDWASGDNGDDPRGTSDHDPQIAKFNLTATIQDLLALLRHFDAEGAFGGRNLAPNLADLLERADRLAAEGNHRSAEPLLRAFLIQLSTSGPRSIRSEASAALARETGLILESLVVPFR